MTKFSAFDIIDTLQFRAVNSGVECYLHTVEAIGSNPIPPNIGAHNLRAFFLPGAKFHIKFHL